jgi:hypothetical protein
MQSHQSDPRIEGSPMSGDLSRHGDVITPQESAQLMRLYEELSDLASKARHVLRSSPQAVALQRIREVDAHIRERIDSIKAIVR